MDEVDGKLNRGMQAADVRASRTRKRQGRTVIDRCSDDRQTERHVDGVPEAGVLEHRQSLIVKHGEEGVGLRHFARDKCGICWQRTEGVYALGARGVDRGTNMPNFLIAEQSGFSGMRVEPAHGDARTFDAERSFEIRMHDTQELQHERLRDGIGNAS